MHIIFLNHDLNYTYQNLGWFDVSVIWHMKILNKLTHYIHELKLSISNSGFEVFKNPTMCAFKESFKNISFSNIQFKILIFYALILSMEKINLNMIFNEISKINMILKTPGLLHAWIHINVLDSGIFSFVQNIRVWLY